jgi:aryl-alcohol dehydrogenase-like predicted oxidoreductase
MSKTLIGLGTAAIGRPEYINIKESSARCSIDEFKQQGLSTLDAAYELGVRYFDTAPGYGMAEVLIQDWLTASDIENVNVGSKWGYKYMANFEKSADVHEIKDHSLDQLEDQWEVSKSFLNALKYYQVHSAGFDTDVLSNDQILRRLHEIKKDNALLVGITTSGPRQVEVIKKALAIKIDNEFLFDTYQVTYNMLDQSLNDVIGQLKSLKKIVIVKEALANGRLFENNNFPHYTPLYTDLKSIAQQHLVGVDAIALRYVMQTVNPSYVLSGASTAVQLEQNLKARDIILSTAEIEMLSAHEISTQQYWEERKELGWN